MVSSRNKGLNKTWNFFWKYEISLICCW